MTLLEVTTKTNFFRAERATMLRQRTNQLLVQFAYMPDPEPILSKNENNVYELRSYKLKSGTQVTFSDKFLDF